MAGIEITKTYLDQIKTRLNELGIRDQDLELATRRYLEGPVSNRISSKKRRMLLDQIGNVNIMTVVDGLAQIASPIVPRSASRNETRVAAQIMTIHAKQEGKLERNEPSSAFSLGSAAHGVAERLAVLSIDKIISDTGASLLCSDGTVKGFYWEARKKVKEQFELPLGFTPEPIMLGVPIEAPESGEISSKWVLQIFKKELEELGTAPTRAFEIEQLLNQPDNPRTKAIIRVIELCQIVFGNSTSMSVIGEKDGKQSIDKNSITAFRAIDWLGIASTIEKRNQEVLRRQKNMAILPELAVGKILFNLKEGNMGSMTVNGGKYDLIEFQLPEDFDHKRSLTQVTIAAKAEFPRFRARYRKKDDEGHDLGGKLGRSLYSYLYFLKNEYGKEMFSHLKISIVDFKFPFGDGDMWRSYDFDRLPMPEHEKKMHDYIFVALCQMYILDSYDDLGVQDGLVAIKPEDVVKFAQDRDLLKRVEARLSYQIPGNSQERIIQAESGEELQKWADNYLARMLKVYPEFEKRRTIRMLSSILRSGMKVEVERKLLSRPPQEIAEWCRCNEGHNYLVLGNLLESCLGDETKSEKFTILKAQSYSQGVVVMWMRVKGLEGIIRIALDKLGKFYISGLPEPDKTVSGSAITSMNNISYMEGAENVWSKVQSELWSRLLSKLPTGNCQNEEEWQKQGYWADEYGNLVKIDPDRPIYCQLDALRGRVSIDRRLLAKAIGELGERDPNGLREQAVVIEQGKDGTATRCPRPDHTDKAAGSAIFHRPGVINCFVCNKSTHVTGFGDEFREMKPALPGDYPDHFRPVSEDRDKAIHSYVDMAARASRLDNTLETYLASRGLTRADLDPCGYVPLDVSRSLGLLETQAKRMPKEMGERVWGWKYVSRYTLPQYVDMLRSHDKPELYAWGRKLLDLPYEQGKLNEFWQSIPMGTLDEWKRRGLIGGDAKMDWDYLGGRLVIPLGFMSGSEWLWSNVNARGVALNGHELYEGMKHRKAFLGKGKGELRSPPPGMWIPHWNEFLNSGSDTVLVTEGAITTASLHKLLPGWENRTVAGMGLTPNNLIAFFRWLGVEGYNAGDRHFCHNKNISRVILSPDFDPGGVKGFVSLARTLHQAFPKLAIEPVQALLRDTDLRKQMRPYNFKVYQEGGKFFDQPKLDYNDFLIEKMRSEIIFNGFLLKHNLVDDEESGLKILLKAKYDDLLKRKNISDPQTIYSQMEEFFQSLAKMSAASNQTENVDTSDIPF